MCMRMQVHRRVRGLRGAACSQRSSPPSASRRLLRRRSRQCRRRSHQCRRPVLCSASHGGGSSRRVVQKDVGRSDAPDDDSVASDDMSFTLWRRVGSAHEGVAATGKPFLPLPPRKMRTWYYLSYGTPPTRNQTLGTTLRLKPAGRIGRRSGSGSRGTIGNAGWRRPPRGS